MESKNNLYFPNLNGLRFIAALMVIVHHIEQIKSLFGMPNHYHFPFVYRVGKLGVILFFVLSGFLITYLLLKEEETPQGISIRHFYVRRILRIWPLYFVVVGMAFFVLPFISFLAFPGSGTGLLQNDLSVKGLLYLFFLSNMALAVFDPIPFASQAWSIGTEEQFYITWPVLMKKVKNKYRLMTVIIGAYLAVKVLILVAARLVSVKELKYFWDMFCIDSMAIGGIMALVLYKREKILSLLFNPYIQIITVGLTVTMIASGFYVRHIQYEIYAVPFSIIIINLAGNPKTIFKIENSIFRYLGKVSYGIYMYHPIAIVSSLKILMLANGANDLVIYPLCVTVTVCLAAVSYRFLEEPFLKLKIKHSQIISGDNTLQKT